jgi:medium-chain acyl-[acyl-carrier-protein] hydrolase
MPMLIDTLSVVSTPWITYYKPNPQARLRLFCFPYAGGGTAVFREWVDQMPDTVEVCPVHLPGREARVMEEPFNRLSTLVGAAAEALLPYLEKPFAFFGHSMGALVSFELARELRRHDLAPAHLFVSGRWPPQMRDNSDPTYDLPDAQFMKELRSLNGTPKEVLEHPALMELMLPMLRADFEVCQTYRYVEEPPLNCPLTVFGGLQDETDRESLENWRKQTTASFSLRMLPGGHFFLHTARTQLIRIVAQELSQGTTS